jgi:polyhydroxyalkanoate synthesis regulator phasin
MASEPLKEQGTNVTVKKIRKEYYMYSENGFGASKVANFSGAIQGIRIAKDTVIRVTSGILNENNSVILSHLHKSIKSLNQLRILEDATIIYTMTRAPERRIFYVDVGNLPKAKAEQYLHDMMARHKNKVTYDPSTGEIRDDRKMMTMTEDYWFPRREGNRSTEVTTLNAGTGLGEDRNLPYFQSKLYKSLNVPIARLQPETMYSFGRMSEVTREELKFAKFIKRLRARFSIIFDRCLERQLVLKGIITPDEWKEIQNTIRYDFMKDNYFEELKEAEILREKLSTLRDIEEHVGKYFSREWIVKNVLYLTDDDWKTMQKQIDKETSEEPPLPGDENQPVAGEQPPPQEQPDADVADESLTVINRKKLKPQRRTPQ